MPNTIAETIAENLQRLVNAKNAIANAITEKGGTVASSDGLEDFASDIATIPGRGNPAKNDVNFYDYDGTIVQSYTKQDFLALQSMPANPSHEGLTAQGWNWELAAAKTYVETYGKLDIGQMYVTSDGKTRIYVHMEDGRLNPELNLTFAEAGSFTVDWGDGTTPNTVSGNASTLRTIAHTYAVPGDYVIAVTVNSGKISIIGESASYTKLFKKANTTNEENRVYSNCIRAINLGNGVISIDDDAFRQCYSLTSITIPSGITRIGTYAFYNCYSLTSITIPSGITRIGTYAFYYCTSLTSIIIPSGVTHIEAYAFQYCYSLTSITIPNEVTFIGSNTFQNCYSLTSITIPNGTTSIRSSTFRSCYSLTSITIPNEVTYIGDYAFIYCDSLASITIPSGVTDISMYAFNRCGGLGYLKFTSNTPPKAGTNTFSNISTDCIIYVPEGKLQAYTTASNYPSSSTYTYREYTET